MLVLQPKPRKVESPESLLPCPGGLNLACFCAFCSSRVFPEKTASGDLSRILVETAKKKCLSPLLGCFIEGLFVFGRKKRPTTKRGGKLAKMKQSGLGISRKIEIHDFLQQLHLEKILRKFYCFLLPKGGNTPKSWIECCFSLKV